MPAAARAEYLKPFWRELMQEDAPPPPPPVLLAPGESSTESSSMRPLAWGVLALGLLGGGLAIQQLHQSTHATPPPVDLTGGMQPIPGLATNRPPPGQAPSPALDAHAVSPSPPPESAQKASEEPKPNKLSGTLTLVTTPKVVVIHNGHALGETPLLKVRLPSGAQRLILHLPDGRTVPYPVSIHPGKNTTIRADLR
jgi:hypothetical protein